MTAAIPWVFQQLGVFAGFAVVLAMLIRPYVRAWINRRIEAGVEEGLRKRLASFQLGIDKELEQYRSRLSDAAERGKIDFALYATKRHEALAGLFAEFLRSEEQLVNMTSLIAPSPEGLSAEQLASFLETVGASDQRRSFVESLRAAGNTEGLGRQLELLARDARYGRAIQARDEAWEAYLRYALYLPETVDVAAIAVRDYFNDAAEPYVLPESQYVRSVVAHRRKLRSLLVEYQNAARADLSRSAIALEPPALPSDQER